MKKATKNKFKKWPIKDAVCPSGGDFYKLYENYYWVCFGGNIILKVDNFISPQGNINEKISMMVRDKYFSNCEVLKLSKVFAPIKYKNNKTFLNIKNLAPF